VRTSEAFDKWKAANQGVLQHMYAAIDNALFHAYCGGAIHGAEAVGTPDDKEDADVHVE